MARAVIANGDGSDPSVPDTRVSPYRRAAVGALMTTDGTVPGGRVDDSLLTRDPRAPFGLRLDAAAVEGAFTDVWQPQSVVLVEGSDLVRADLSSRFASEAAGRRLRDAALRRTDALIGRLLDHVDLERDLVIVVGTAPRLDDDSLTVAGVTGPGFAPGLLRSTTTQRDGFVNITDVAPTVLHAFGIDRPDAMEGRRMESAAGSASLADRTATLADANTDGLFRDGLIGASMGVVLGVACGLGLLVVVFDRVRRLAFLRGPIVFVALWELAFLDAVFLAGPLHFARHGGRPAYWAFVLLAATVLAAAFLLVARRRPVDAVLVGLGSVALLHLVDLVTGAHLEWSTVFGYSPTIGVRFVGEGNMTFALLSASVTLFAGLLAWRVPTPAGRRVAIGLLVVTVLVIGAPFWGNDFGGAVSAAPGLRAARLAAARPQAPLAHRRAGSRWCCSSPGSWWGWSTCCARRSRAPTSASSSRRWAPTSARPPWCCAASCRRTSRCSPTRCSRSACSSRWGSCCGCGSRDRARCAPW